jgi:hypothetical protein
MRRCYLAGPMRGFPNLNFPAFHRAAAVLKRMGWDVISPAQNDIDAGEPWTDALRPDWANVDFPFTSADCRRMVKRDVDLLLSLSPENGDCIFVLDGWNKSTGAHAEASVGKWLLLPINHIWFELCRDNCWITQLHQPGDPTLTLFDGRKSQ